MNKLIQNKKNFNNLLSIIRNYENFKNCEIKSLKLLKNQGLNNLVYLLDTSLEKCIVKKYGNSLHNNVSNKNQYDILHTAYKKSICPKPLLLDERHSLFLYYFIKARHKFRLHTTNLKNLAVSLKKLHDIKYSGEKFHIKEYFKSQKIDKELRLALISLKSFKKDFVLSHNDLNPKNILFSSRVKFIDWEFVSLNDRYFDLAAICVEFKLHKEKEKIFANFYFKNQKADFNKLNIFKIIYENVCYTWLKNRG
ncbi:MAG: phosphotransferase [Epsilonproteobacteria bacterium]|nr:phosphotransferase [Campylobacterota bacterium]